jgi:N-acetylmuramoyl-L-alanine amidase
MALRHKPPEFRQWTESVAGAIGDPVRRLRFLRAVSPALSDARSRRARRIGGIALFAAATLATVVFLFLSRASARVAVLPPPPPAPHAPFPGRGPQGVQSVWEVEDRNGIEVYSNGLRIDRRFTVPNHPRSYLAFPAAGDGAPLQRSQPAGIVFHSTESQIAPFEAGHNQTLKRIGESLLDYVRRRHSYHFLIDRFGRVYRVVAEADAANHAGYSVWADDASVYVNLNESFLGVAFESRMDSARGEPAVTPAQTRSGLMLVEMLRARYRIPSANCVTHAQVSVSPVTMRVGYHVDWAFGFPFAELGLPDNYGAALPSVWLFGFQCDPALLPAGAEAAEAILARRAAVLSLKPAAYRKRLQQQYRQKLALVRHPDT